MRRHRHAKIIATLGPASSDPERIRELFLAGADVFRLNFSHGTIAQHRARVDAIRAIEERTGRPIAILLDLQGPKLRLGEFLGGEATLVPGADFRLDLSPEPGDDKRAPLPHSEVFAALRPGSELLLDDGKVRLHVRACGGNFAETVVRNGGTLSDHKGVNVPGVVLPLSSLTEKDRSDLGSGLDMGVDWIAASFIQRREDLVELRRSVDGRAQVMAKLEKPAAIDHLEGIVELSDGIMVARGDLGVEVPPERVPTIQKRVIQACRHAGKPVVIATQMLESMIHAPRPTRAEASDVAGAVYEGVDAVMLSAETAMGEYPADSVAMMDRIIGEVERDPQYLHLREAERPSPQPTPADAVCDALRHVAQVLPVAVVVTFTSSGFSALRAARERPKAPILGITGHLATARRLALAWGIHPVPGHEVERVQQMVDTASTIALREGFADVGQIGAIVAGMPFGHSGTTNLIHIVRIGEPAAAG